MSWVRVPLDPPILIFQKSPIRDFCYSGIVKPISANQMIAEFLKAELHSSRFREGSLKALRMCGYEEVLLEHPDCNNPIQNKKRAEVLNLCRGWPDTDLFMNFPSDTMWFSTTILLGELKESYRLKSSYNMTDIERSLKATGSKVMEGSAVENINNNLILEIRKKIEVGEQLPPIILVAVEREGKKVLLEGHSRSVAYSTFEQLDFDIPAIIGISNNMNDWAYF